MGIDFTPIFVLAAILFGACAGLAIVAVAAFSGFAHWWLWLAPFVAGWVAYLALKSQL